MEPMKTVYLVRHAKSSWDDPLQKDFDRPLNKRGRRDAPRMGKRLQEREIHPDLLLSSPAERALSSCLLIAEKIGYTLHDVLTDRRLYHAGDDQLMSLICDLNDEHDEVMIVAHNPGLTDFVNRASREPVIDNIPTCGVVALKFPVRSWNSITWGKGEMMFFDFPKEREG
jgi:phosphohistidine phosphatase